MQNLPSNSKILSAVPFGANGDKSAIPVGASETAMNWDTGFPEIFSRLISDNGKYVKREDMNAILYALSNEILFQQWGGAVMYDSSVAAAIFGYPQYAKLVYKDADGNLSFIESQVPNNSIVPSAATIDVKTDSTGAYSASGIVRWKTVLSNTSQVIPSINVPILTPMWFDHEVTSQAWVLSVFDYAADTEKHGWIDKDSAQKVYNHLAAEAALGTASTETIGETTVSYILCDDGHKIIMANGTAKTGSTYNNPATAADTVFAATGIAWYYVLDTTNQCFRLPRTKFKSFGFGNTAVVKGNGKTLGLTNGTDSGGLSAYQGMYIGDSLGNSTSTTIPSAKSVLGKLGVVEDADKSGLVADLSSNTVPTNFYLYFATGRTNADEVNPGGGGVIDGTLLKEMTEVSVAANATSFSYTVENDCLLYLETTGMDIEGWGSDDKDYLDIYVNESKCGRLVDLYYSVTANVDYQCCSIPVKKGSSIVIKGDGTHACFASATTVNFYEYALVSIAPQIAMPDYSATPTTVTNGWSATENGWIRIHIDDVHATSNDECYINNVLVFDTLISSVYYSTNLTIIPVSVGDTVNFGGSITVDFYPCKTIQQSTPPVYCNGSGHSEATGYWWRTYSDGFCEQGGTLASGTTVELPKSFASTAYQVEANGVAVSNKQTSQFTMASTGDWCAKGYIV